MQEVPIDKLMDKTNSIYKLVILAARRTLELSEGGAKLVEAETGGKMSGIALKEIAEGKISFKTKEEK